MRKAVRGALPRGAGGVRCLDCNATAAADGRGTPIVLKHAEDCPNAVPLNDLHDLHQIPCPSCGCEPEVVRYWRNKASGERVGYDCTCGATVINGMYVGTSMTR